MINLSMTMMRTIAIYFVLAASLLCGEYSWDSSKVVRKPLGKDGEIVSVVIDGVLQMAALAISGKSQMSFDKQDGKESTIIYRSGRPFVSLVKQVAGTETQDCLFLSLRDTEETTFIDGNCDGRWDVKIVGSGFFVWIDGDWRMRWVRNDRYFVKVGSNEIEVAPVSGSLYLWATVLPDATNEGPSATNATKDTRISPPPPTPK